VDVGAVEVVRDAVIFAGGAAASGTIGNSVYDGMKGLVAWFRGRGHEPSASWAQPEIATVVAGEIGDLDSASVTALRDLLATARQENSLAVNSAHVVGSPGAKVTQIGSVGGDVTIN
jgi:hypothetical protein